MKRIFILFLFCLFFSFSATAYVNTSSAYIVLESTTGRILNQRNIHQQFLVASTVKILTAMTVIETEELDEVVQIDKKDVSEVGSKVYLKEQEKITKRDLLYALLLRSANDAASALSKNNDSRFILKMNQLAKKIGMKNSVFANASGLDEREYNLSTAYDMALLSAYANQNPTFIEIASTHTYTAKTDLQTYTWINKHRLVKNDDDFVWGKTGYTKKSKRILVTNYQKENMDLIVVTINDSDDWNHHRQLVDQVDSYEFVSVLKKGIYDTKLDVSYYIYIPKDITIPIRKNENEKIQLEFKLYPQSATLEIYLNDAFVASKNIEVYTKENFDVDLVIDFFK